MKNLCPRSRHHTYTFALILTLLPSYPPFRPHTFPIPSLPLLPPSPPSCPHPHLFTFTSPTLASHGHACLVSRRRDLPFFLIRCHTVFIQNVTHSNPLDTKTKRTLFPILTHRGKKRERDRPNFFSLFLYPSFFFLGEFTGSIISTM